MIALRSVFIVCCCLLSLSVCSQRTHVFTEGLAANVGPRYGREAVYSDPLAYKLYQGELQLPAEGTVFGVDEKGSPANWEKITADSLGRLRSGGGYRYGGRGRNYIYLNYIATRSEKALLNIKGNSGVFVNGVLHAGDAYGDGYLYLPVELKKGRNDFYVRGGSIVAELIFPEQPVFFSKADLTLPSIVPGLQDGLLRGAVVVINTSSKEIKALQIKTDISGKTMTTAVPAIPPMSTRKVPFDFEATGVHTQGKIPCTLTLFDKSKTLSEITIHIESVKKGASYSSTFTSDIDGSLQYYAVTPQSGSAAEPGALFLSVHGAGVEAIGQARAYRAKDWGNLVAATNRRPRGFNWEDWGRLDALEVLGIARAKFKPDPQKVYLTGHSMGGHGTWFLGATYPDKWAAIAPCAGYPTLKGYGSADGLVPESSSVPVEQLLLRAGNQSDVIKLASNYKPLGVYVFHGDADPTVSVRYARQMREILGGFHPDLSYYEYPGGSHWFGNQSVDWPPIFDFFKWHTLKPDSTVDRIDFKTASPGISASYRWAAIEQQLHPLEFSRIQLERDKKNKTVKGTTENTRLLKLDLAGFPTGAAVTIDLDSTGPVQFMVDPQNEAYLVKEDGKWRQSSKPDAFQKGAHRYGTLKDGFNHNMVFVYGTSGTKAENEWSFNKARYDAETWYYRGNGAVDIIADKDYSLTEYKDRGVVLFGNRSTNRAWNILLQDCPIQVDRNGVDAGRESFSGDDLGAYFVWPVPGSTQASVAVISGTGLKGMHAASANQYFAGASGFPDFMVFSLDMVKDGVSGVKMAGFFDHNWKLSQNEYSVQ